MCGYLLGWNFAGKTLPFDQEIKNQAFNFLRYRGPDEFNVERFDQGFAVHARLNIRGGSGGRQPINSENCVFLYNGELYDISSNYQSDTLFFYENFQSIAEQSVALDGIFSAVHVNKDSNEVCLVRDKWGTKPLFYAVQNSVLYASSSLRLLSTLIVPTLDENAINNYRTLGFFPGVSTPFKEIKKAPTGNILSLKYQNGNVEFKEIALKEDKQHYTGVVSIERAVNSQLISDVPVGLLLSGGVDSSILAKLLDKNANINGFNVTSPDLKNLDEKDNVKIINKSIKNEIISLQISIDNLNETFNKAVMALDIPVSDSSIILNYSIYEKMREYLTPVCLTGIGADELFGGYTRYAVIKYSWFLRIFGRMVPKFILEYVSRYTSNVRIKKFLTNRCQNYIDLFSDSDLNNKSAYFVPLKKDEILKFEREEYLSNALLSFTDGISMAHSIEARVPYLSKYVASPDVLNNNYFSSNKNHLKMIRRKIFNSKFNEEKKGFALKNNELSALGEAKNVTNRKDFADIILAKWLSGFGISFDNS